MKILVVEDEVKVANFIRRALEEAGMTVDLVSTYSDLKGCLKSTPYDVLVLDRMIPGHDLAKSLPEIRQTAPQTKVLILSALTNVEDKVHGLTEGADDYLGKPFHVSELVARIRSLVRRDEKSQKANVLAYENLNVDLETQRVTREGARIDLTAKEYRLLCLLLRHPDRIFSKMEILDQVWDMNHYPESNVVEVTVALLRSKVDRKPQKPLIQNRRGAGYWLGES